MIDTAAQAVLMCTGLACVWYTAQGNTLRACAFGLAGEPFWFVTAGINRQWGIIALSVVYGAIFAVGLRRSLRKRKHEGK